MLNSRFTLMTTMGALLLGGSIVPDGTLAAKPSVREDEKGFTSVAKKAIPAVVFIKTQGQVQNDDEGAPFRFQHPFDPFGEDFFQRFFGAPRGWRGQPNAPQMSQGSGFLVSADGYIMTNAHVVKNAEKIVAVLNDGREMDAVLVGADPHTDIAIVKIDGRDFPYLTLGNSDGIDIGEWVIAIGSPFQLEASLTVGVVSAKGRQNLRLADLEDFIQTDAAINPGNSGGPLLDLNSEVIGINSAICSRNGGYMGIGFAIPSNMAKHVMEQLIDKGVVTRGFLGVSLQPVDKDIADGFGLSKPEGVLVSDVVKDSPADKAGLKQGDIILECNKTPIKSAQSFRNEVSLSSPGHGITLKVNRKGQILNLPVTLGTATDEVATNSILRRLGMDVENMTADIAKQLGYTSRDEGVVITNVKPGSLAALAGLRTGYLIQAVNHRRVANVSEFNDALNQVDKNKRVLLLVRHGNMTRFYSVKVE